MTARATLRCLIAVIVATSSFPQSDDSRRLWSDGFKQQRVSPAKKTKAPATGTDAVPAPEDSFVGVTVWRLRPSKPGDETRFRGLVHRKDAAEWTAIRRPLAESIRLDEDIRLSIESTRQGYLYVFDRDLYADGTTSPPNLIFPTIHLRGGKNEVRQGIPVEIPDAADSPPTFRVEPTRADQVGLRLTVLVTPKQLPDVVAGSGSQQISDTKLKNWERGVTTSYVGGNVSGSYTRAERDAATQVGRPLAAGDPLPAGLFKAVAKPGQPIVVVFNLKIAQPGN
jgi:hypothetical protein